MKYIGLKAERTRSYDVYIFSFCYLVYDDDMRYGIIYFQAFFVCVIYIRILGCCESITYIIYIIY